VSNDLGRFGRKQLWPNLATGLIFAWGTEENHGNIRIASFLAETQTDHL
jgi:hypothetical protein